MRPNEHRISPLLTGITSRSSNRFRLSTTAQSGPPAPKIWIRRPDYKPSTPDAETDLYVLTLRTDKEHHERMTKLRRSYFPSSLLKVNAHITLFHALPRSHLAAITAHIDTIARYSIPFSIHAIDPYLLGTQGVAVRVRSKRATSIYQHLRDQWHGFLSGQDKTFTPHYTIQNKVDKNTAEATLQELRHKFPGSSGIVEGLTLHTYDKGYWSHYRSWSFKGITMSRTPSWFNQRDESRVEGAPDGQRQDSANSVD